MMTRVDGSSGWPRTYEHRIRNVRFRNGLVLLFLYALAARQLGPARAAIIVILALGAIYVVAWAEVCLSRRRANAGRVKRFVISGASATALVRLAALKVRDGIGAAPGHRDVRGTAWRVACH
jgi:hypothetical protein